MEVLVEKFNTPMNRAKMVCLRPNTWLNDEVRASRSRSLPQLSPVFVTDVAVSSSRADVCYWRTPPKMQVINFYMCMLQERDDQLCEGIPGRKASHFFNSFFMERLLISDHAYTYSNVRRWSKKFDSFAQEKIFFPVRFRAPTAPAPQCVGDVD
jgi:hypothetical protein